MSLQQLIVFHKDTLKMTVLDRYNKNLNRRFVDMTADVVSGYETNTVKAVRRKGEMFIYPFQYGQEIRGDAYVGEFPAKRVYPNVDAYAVHWLGMDLIHDGDAKSMYGRMTNPVGKFSHILDVPLKEHLLPMCSGRSASTVEVDEVFWEVVKVKDYITMAGVWYTVERSSDIHEFRYEKRKAIAANALVTVFTYRV